MLKRIVVALLVAAVFPLLYWLMPRENHASLRTDNVIDEEGYSYILLSGTDEMMFMKSDSAGEIIGSRKIDRAFGYDYIVAEAVEVLDGELYVLLSEINSRDFMINSRQLLKFNFEENTEEVVFQKQYGNIQNAYNTTLTAGEGKIFITSSLIEGILVTDVYGNTEQIITPQTNAVVNYAATFPDGRVVYSDVLGRIYLADENQTQRVYQSKTAGSFSEPKVYQNGFFTILDTATGEHLISTDSVFAGELAFEPAPRSSDAEISSYHEKVDMAFIGFLCCGIVAGIIVFVLMSLKKFPFLLKIAVILTLCLGLGGSYLYVLISDILEQLHLTRNLEKANLSAQIVTAEIDIEQYETIDWGSPDENGYYSVLAKLLEYDGSSESILTANNGDVLSFSDKNYCQLYPIVDGEIRTGICDEQPVNLPLEMIADEKLVNEYRRVKEGEVNAIACGIDDDSFDWVVVVSPLKNSSGEIVALIETGISKFNFANATSRNSLVIMGIVVVFELISGGLILLAAGIALLPLKKLHKAVDATSNGSYGAEVKVRGRDEIAGIARSFNVMSRQIYEHTQSLSKLNEAYLRFLPSGIISSIGKSSVLLVSRGDYSSISDYILHIRLINFSEQIAGLPNDAAFELINNISREIMEGIIAKSGVIESYNQDEYICIFSDANNAYKSAADLVGQLRAHYPQMKTAFVIVKDEVLLGIVGHEKRLGTIMLSSGIRLSKKLGEIASSCGVNLIITSDVTLSVVCPQRLLGKIEFDEREYSFFDCFGSDENSVFLSKQSGVKQFEEMVALYYQNRWQECLRSALTYLERHKNDLAAIRYLFLCKNNIKSSEENGDEMKSATSLSAICTKNVEKNGYRYH